MTETAPLIPGTHPDTGLYHIDHMPMPDEPQLRAVREKQLAGEPLSIGEAMHAGRDNVERSIDEPVGGKIETFEMKLDHVYRAVGYDALAAYNEAGSIMGQGEDDEYAPGNNKGVDWYLGGVARKYGELVLEAPADPAYFVPAREQGHALAKDPQVRHMKSSGSGRPVPAEMVRIVQG